MNTAMKNCCKQKNNGSHSHYVNLNVGIAISNGDLYFHNQKVQCPFSDTFFTINDRNHSFQKAKGNYSGTEK
ncbi:hypothetical protein [Sphingobacterium sp. IITKGP-BTPF85]|uniref:hypothetical protein n=1 Tax=Sphingobacterium sp. IITKGP-BTPF85 TaxID=1338009 RepID=UPI0012E019AA|nr:hypothetical protein [Sphingobacterium sp. IITKGP-BTPF85]